MSKPIETHPETLANLAAAAIGDDCDGRGPEYFGNFGEENCTADRDDETEVSQTCSQGDRHNDHNDHTPPDDDILGGATDPAAEAVAKAVAVVEQALNKADTDPGALAGDDFNEALKLLREEAPEEWFRVRGKLKQCAKTLGLKLGDIERASSPPGDGADETTQADEIVAVVREQAELFHAADGICYATLLTGPALTYRLDTQAFSEWASYAYYSHTATDTQPGCAASESALRTVRTVLTGIAKHEGDERQVFLRVAKHEGIHYIDLGTADGRAIEVTAGGWRLIDRPAVHFWRSSTMRPLPAPVPGGDLAKLWQYANIPDESRPLVLAFLLESWRPETPFPVLELTGQQGTAKSSTQAKLRRCVDPNAVDLRAAPKSVEDLFVSAGANWFASLNNLSHLSAGIQDALCNLATGGGFAGRTLFTNADETVVEAKRPVMINGIVPLVTAQDLTDRVVHIDLPELTTYRTEAAIDADFDQDHASIVGGLLDLFVKTLAELPAVTLDRPPRMADFTLLGEAMMRASESKPGTFLGLYLGNRSESVSRSLDASPVACAIREMVEADNGRSSPVWDGPMGKLLDRLSDFRDGAEAWPKSARGLGDALRRQRPALAQIGIGITIAPHGREGVRVIVSRLERDHCDHRDRHSDRGFSKPLAQPAVEVEV